MILYISKDELKELLFENLGWSTREWSMKLGRTSYELLFQILQTQLESGLSCIVETAFIPEYHTKRFLDIINKYNIHTVQIFCNADISVLYKRFTERSETSERHPGHVDHLVTVDEFEKMIKGNKYGKLDLGASVIDINTTDFKKVNYENLIDKLRLIMNPVI